MGVRVKVEHLRRAGMCARAARPWFAEQGLSWSSFVSDGIDADTLIETNDMLALKVVAVAEAEAAEDGGRG
jgi:hypothetical protein